MKILHSIHSTNPNTGGPIAVISGLYQGLKSKGFDTEVISLDDENSAYLDAYPYKIHAMGRGRPKSYGYNLKFLSWLKSNLSKYDAVIIHGTWLFNGWGVHKILKDSKTPYFQYTHGMLDPWFIHAYPHKRLKKEIYWKFIERKILRDAKNVIFTCQQEYELAKNSFSRFQCKAAIASLGVEAIEGKAKDFYEKYPELERRNLILFFGRIDRKKGVDLLIDAFAKLDAKNATLVIAGPCKDDEYLQELHDSIKKWSLENSGIIFTGMLKGKVKAGVLEAAEVFALPSHQENFGISVVEALSTGTPVLLSDQVNIYKEIEAENAAIVGRDDFIGTYQSLQKWFQLRSEDKKQMRFNAKEAYKKLFSKDKAVQKLIEILSK